MDNQPRRSVVLQKCVSVSSCTVHIKFRTFFLQHTYGTNHPTARHHESGSPSRCRTWHSHWSACFWQTRAFFHDLRRKGCGSVSTMTPHQCWNVCDWRDQPSETQLSLSSHAHTSKGRKTSFRLWPSRFRKVAKPPSNLLNKTQHQEAHKQKEGKPSFRRRHEMFKTVPSLQALSLKVGTWHQNTFTHSKATITSWSFFGQRKLRREDKGFLRKRRHARNGCIQSAACTL